MGVIKLKPTTPGQRFRTAPSFDEITTDKPEKSLLAPIKKYGCRIMIDINSRQVIN